jgi:hypothetical protein
MSVIAMQQNEPCYEKKVDISSTLFNKLINLCVNCNCVTLLFYSEVMSYFNAATSVYQKKRFPLLMLPEY